MLNTILIIAIFLLIVIDIRITVNNSNDLEKINIKLDIILDGIYPNKGGK